VCEQASPDGELEGPDAQWQASVRMLHALLDGSTYEEVAEQHGLARTAVQRRIKTLARHAASIAGIKGLNEDGAAFVSRLRLHRSAVLAAVANLTGPPPQEARDRRVLSEEEVAKGAARIRVRSQQAQEDTALFYLLLATGARPLEVARLEVRDYLNADGTVRRTSSLRAEFAINGRSRPLFFRSARLDEAMDAYLGQRIRRGLSMSGAAAYRGLVPDSRLFLSASGEGFEIKPYGVGAQRRFLCRGIQETYRKIFHYAELEKVTALTIRHTVADRLYRRGADEMQVGLLLGITERSAVREQFPRPQPSLDELTDDLI
jgi:integrase